MPFAPPPPESLVDEPAASGFIPPPLQTLVAEPPRSLKFAPPPVESLKVESPEEASQRLSRPAVKLPDGSLATVRSIGVGDERGQWVIPTIVNGVPVSNEDATRLWRQGKNEPIGGPFNSIDESNDYAQKFHLAEANRLAKQPFQLRPTPLLAPPAPRNADELAAQNFQAQQNLPQPKADEGFNVSPVEKPVTHLGFGQTVGLVSKLAGAGVADIGAELKRELDELRKVPTKGPEYTEPSFGGANLAAVVAGQETPMAKALKLSAEESKARGDWPTAEVMGAASQSLSKALPKFAAMSVAGPGLLAQSIAAGGLFGIDEEGNFHPRDAAVAALLPGVGAGARIAAGAAIGRLVAGGSKALANPLAQKVVETISEQAALDAYMTATSAPELIQQYKEDPHGFWLSLASIGAQNLGFAIAGAGRFDKRVPSETQEWIKRTAESKAANLVTHKIVEEYPPDLLKAIYSRVQSNDPSATVQEQNLVKFINSQIGKPAQAIEKGVRVTTTTRDVSDLSKFWQEYLGLKGVSEKTVEIPGVALPPSGRTLIPGSRLLTRGGTSATYPIEQQGSAPVEPAGVVPVREAQNVAESGNRVPSPAGQPPTAPVVTPPVAPSVKPAVAETPDQIKTRERLARIAAGINPAHIRITVSKSQEVPSSNYIQVDEIHPKLGNTFSSNADQLIKDGFPMPTNKQLLTLPAGQYSLPEANNLLAQPPETPKSSTQLTLPAHEATLFVQFAKSIPDADVYHKPDASGKEDYGIETQPHITVLYGLTKHEPAPVAQIVATKSPITVTLGKTSVFSGKDYDVLKVDVSGKDLHTLNTEISKLPNEQTHPTYQPHLTIAYLKKGMGAKYAGNDQFDGKKITFNSVTFSPPQEMRAEMGKPELPFSSQPTIESRIRKLMSRSEGMMSGAEKAREIAVMAKEQGVTVKEMQEQIEAEVVRIADETARDIADPPHLKFGALLGLYNRQPTMSARTSTSVADQAYSTPAPLSYALGHAIGVMPSTPVYDSTAGNGMMLIGGDLSSSQGNEKNPSRAEALRKLGVGTVTEHDGTKYVPSAQFEIVKVNPPFGAIDNVNYGGYSIKRLEHLISLKALEAMADDGAAALILGAKREVGEQGKGAQWVFENYLYGHYNVMANFEVEGDLYAKQGASWPVRVIVIHGRRQVPIEGDLAPKTVERLATWDQVWQQAERIHDEIDQRRQAMGAGGNAGLPLPPAGGGPAAGQPGVVPSQPIRPPGAAGGAVKPGGKAGGKPKVAQRPAAGSAPVAPGGTVSRPEDQPLPAPQPGGTGRKAPRVEKPVGGGKGAPANVPAGGAPTGAKSGLGVVPGSVGLKPRAAGDLNGLTEAELDAMLDQAFSNAAATAPPAVPVTPQGPVATPSPIPAGQSAASIAADAAKAGVAGAEEALKGLHDLFGSGAHLGIGPTFDEKSYEKARPHFESAWDSFKKAGKSLLEFFQFIARKFGDGIRSYLKRFVELTQAKEREAPEAPAKGAPTIKGTEHQVLYEPRSKATPFGTLTPRNIAAGTFAALDALQARVGPVDEFVANRLGMEVEQVRTVMAAEQVDGVALAIDQIETGGALIIGDETGIGKGRQGAAIIRYAIQHGKVPVFFTKDPKLFTDMYGDLADIWGLATPNLLTSVVKPFIMGDPAKAAIVDQEGTKLHRAPTGDRQKAEMARILNGGWEASGYNAIFATYSQVNQRNARQAFFEQLAGTEPTIVIMDEAHEAAGDAGESMQAAFFSGGVLDRGSGADKHKISVPGLLNASGTKLAQGGGVLYMSATYAKRPDNMPVYFRTALSKAAQSFGQIVDAMKRGGVALQQAVSEALAQSGQYVRRERDFTGVTYDMKTVGTENVEQLKDEVDQVTDVLSEIVRFSQLIRAAVAAESEATSTAMSETQMSATDFASIVHNQVGQLLLAAKADAVVAEALAAHTRKEKPVIALMNTMEAFLDHWGEDKGLKTGQAMQLRWNELLKYALSRCLRVTEKTPQGDTVISQADPEDFGLGDEFRQIEAAADAITSKFPISPIDYIIQKLARAGLKIHELTGRESGIEYTNFETGEGIYRKFKKANKNTVVNTFNNTEPDGMLLNASGSTGLSAHASVKFKAQWPRCMIVAQPSHDINVFIQTLGRIKRTGMVLLGRDAKGQPYGAKYLHLILPLQAELRPAAMTARKMKSLNANTTAEADNAIKIQSEDFFNKYGDAVVSEYLDQHPELQMATGIDIETRDDGSVVPKIDVARKFTGRMAYRPDAEQKQVYEDILPAYRQLIEQLKATNEYDLEVVIHSDWDGLRTSDEQLAAGTDESNIFTAGVRVQQWEIADHRHVPTGAEMQKEFERRTGGAQKLGDKWRKFQTDVANAITERQAALEKKLTGATEPTEKLSAESSLKALAETERRWDKGTRLAAHDLVWNAGYLIELDHVETGDHFEGMVVDVKFPHPGVRISPSSIKFRVAVNAPGGVLFLSAQSFASGEWMKDETDLELKDMKAATKGQRYQRYFIVGNPIRGYQATGGKGKVVRFKAREGGLVTGLLMPNKWGPEKLASDPRLDLVNGGAVKHFLRNYGDIVEAGGIVRIAKRGGEYTISTSSARRTGGGIYLDPALLKITGDFTKVGMRMTATVSERDLAKAADRIMRITEARFRPVGRKDVLMPQVAESNNKGNVVGGAQASLPGAEAVVTPEAQEAVTAKSVDDLRAILPKVGLHPQAEALLSAFLESPVAKLLPELKARIADSLDNGWQGSYFQGLIEIARNADPITGVHEFMHAVWDVLPDDIKAEFERIRQTSLDSLIDEAREAGQDERVKALSDLKESPTLGGEDFLSRHYPASMAAEMYPFSSAEETFAHSGSERFKQRVGSKIEGFWARIKQIIGDFIGALKKALRLKQSQREWLDNILRGNFEPTPRNVREQAQASLSPEQLEAQRKLAIEQGEEAGRIPTRVFGKDYYVIDRERITPESIAASSALAKEMLDAAAIPAVEQDVPQDDPWEARRGWIMTPQGRDMTAEGQTLLERLKREIASKDVAPKTADRLANILNSVRLNFVMGENSAMGEMDPGVRLELFSAAQSEASYRGAALGALAGYSKDLSFIGHNLDVELGRVWSDAFGGDDLRRVLDELQVVRGKLTGAEAKAADLEQKLNDALKKLLPRMAKKWGADSVIGKKIIELIRRGEGEPWEILKELARTKGWKVPTDEELAKVKKWADDLDRLSQLSAREASGKQISELDALTKEKLAALDAKIADLRRSIGTFWERVTRPLTLKTQTGRANIVQATGEYVAANLLLKIGFATRQLIDVTLGQALLHTPTRAAGAAIGIHFQQVEAGKRKPTDLGAFWGDMGDAISQAYKQRTQAIRAAFMATRQVFSGAEHGRNTARLMERIGVFDRAMQKADEMALAGRKVEAGLLRLFTYMQLGYRVAQALDNLQGVPAIYQEMRQQVVAAMRRLGMNRAEAETKADWVMGDMKAEWLRAKPDAQQWLEQNGFNPTDKEVEAAAWRLVQARQYERIRSLKLPADDFEERNKVLLNTIGWNLQEKGGLGGLAADIMRGGGRLAGQVAQAPGWMAPVTMPLSLALVTLTRFGNAVGILINRKLSWTPLGFAPGAFGVNERNIDPETGLASGGSPFYHSEEDRRQRKAEATVGTSFQALFFLLAATGFIVVRLKWPKDKAERQLWDKMGWKPGQVSIPSGPDSHITLSMNTGPLVVMSSGLAAGGAVRDLLDGRQKKQETLNTEAEKRGLTPGKIRPLNGADLLDTAAQAAWSGITSGRTISGILGSFSDYGMPNASKTVASVISPLLPTLPAAQELGRMGGASLDSQMASVWDFLMPLPTSRAAQVNLLGDQVGSANGVQRVVQTLTGGNYPFPVNDKARQSVAGYDALFNSGYRPPSIDRNKGYAINGEYRPLTDSELQEYTIKRGQYLKEELTDLGPDASKQAAQQAYQRANQQALGDIGVDTGRSAPTTARGGAATPAGVGQAASGAGVTSTPRLPSARARGAARPRGVSLRRAGAAGSRGGGLGLRRGARGPSLQPTGRGLSLGRVRPRRGMSLRRR